MNSSNPRYLTVDLGGTSLRFASFDEAGNLLGIRTTPSAQLRQPQALIEYLLAECSKLSNIQGLALGIPGLVDSQKGIVHQSPHFPLWKDFPIKAELARQLRYPILMDNDANYAALGESWRGASCDWPNFILLTLGTGVGGGIIIHREIFHGANGFAGEFGHIIIEQNGLAGALGIRGTLETFCSQSGLQLQISSMLQDGKNNLGNLPLNPKDSDLPEQLAALAKSCHSIALEIWKKFGIALACGLASLTHSFGIENFVIGGGLAGAWELFYPHCKNELPHRLYSSLAPRIQIRPAELGNNAGLIGGLTAILKLKDKI